MSNTGVQVEKNQTGGSGQVSPLSMQNIRNLYDTVITIIHNVKALVQKKRIVGDRYETAMKRVAELEATAKQSSALEKIPDEQNKKKKEVKVFVR